MKAKFTDKSIYRDIGTYRANLKAFYINKYYNLFYRHFIITGLNIQQIDYIIKSFWKYGTLCAFKFPHIQALGFAPYTTLSINMYDFTEDFNVVNKKGLNGFPTGALTNGINGAIGYAQPTHEAIYKDIKILINKLVNVEMVLNTNMQTHKMPYVIATNSQDTKHNNEIIDQILEDNPVLFASFEDLQNIKTLVNNTPYIIDKLYQYKINIENEILTHLGIDNAMQDNTKDRLIVDEVNANNAVINSRNEILLNGFKDFFNEINFIFGYNIDIKLNVEEVKSVHEYEEDDEQGGVNNE